MHLLGYGLAPAAVKQRQHGRRAQTEQCARGTEPAQKTGTFQTRRCVKGEDRIERRSCNTHLGICGGDTALCRRDIGPPFEQFRGNTGGNLGRFAGQRFENQSEVGRRFSDEDGNGMFEFRTLDRNVQSLRARRFELSLRLRDVGFGCDTSSEAVLRQVEGFLITVNG